MPASINNAACECEEHYWKCVYVIELDPRIFGEAQDFHDLNLHYEESDPETLCLYVGRTGHEPEVRYRQHLEGYKSCSKVKKYAFERMASGMDCLRTI